MQLYTIHVANIKEDSEMNYIFLTQNTDYNHQLCSLGVNELVKKKASQMRGLCIKSKMINYFTDTRMVF